MSNPVPPLTGPSLVQTWATEEATVTVTVSLNPAMVATFQALCYLEGRTAGDVASVMVNDRLALAAEDPCVRDAAKLMRIANSGFRLINGG